MLDHVKLISSCLCEMLGFESFEKVTWMITFVFMLVQSWIWEIPNIVISEQLYMTCIIEIWIFRSNFCRHEILNLENL